MALETAYAGIDLGGTKMLAVIVDAEGTILASEERPTLAGEGAESVMSRMANMVRELMARSGKRATQAE